MVIWCKIIYVKYIQIYIQIINYLGIVDTLLQIKVKTVEWQTDKII